MSTEQNTLSVKIFGNEYKIKGADPGYIAEVAAYVDGKMTDLDQRLSASTPTKIAVLTSLNLADELFREREEKKRLLEELRDRAQALGSTLDACLDEG
jgi:cell division protein ZapA